MSLNFQVKADFSQTTKMIERFGKNAVTEYRTAITNTSIYGLREVKTANPVRTGTSKNAWKWKFAGKLASVIHNKVNYLDKLVSGWARNSPIVAKGKALVFEVGQRRFAKSSTASLYKRYAKAIASLRKKEFKSRVKERYNSKGRADVKAKELARQATAKSGVVVVRRVNSPASFKGNDFITPVVSRIDRKFMQEVSEANRRLIA